jgi:DNA mismatch repair protein MutL
MSKIRILPEDISNRIAAGEVIERPASVVKELVENSIDAGATNIIVNIEQAGKKLISVADNGDGMDADDTLLCFEPHATSKIIKLEDMDRITTMGFRGEALPSIASISRFKLRTRKNNTLEGNEVFIEGGKFISSSPAGCASGTEMAVRDLFYNTPARRKFLRTDNTEEKHIIDIFCQIALAHHNISFELLMNSAKIISSPADNSLLPRIQSFFGKTMKDALLSVKFEKAGISVNGYIAKHGFTKKTRKEQRTYINNRPVESAAIFRGLRNGYESLVMKGCFPPVILFLNMAPERVDFNVHPAKREVRFRESGLVANVVTDAIRETLRQATAPSISIPSELPFTTILSGATVNYTPADKEQEIFPEIMPTVKATIMGHITSQNPLPDIVPEITTNIALEPPIAQEEPAQITSSNEKPLSEQEALKSDTEFGILAFLDDTYILASAESGLVIIDQHAAHERILFEKLMDSTSHNSSISQKLLIPVTIELSRSEIQFLKKNSDPFQALGFEVESFGQNTVIIHAIPPSLNEDDAALLFSEILTTIIDDEYITGKADKATIAKIACSKAVKAHDTLTIEEAESLIKQMSQCRLPYSCPHGRPTIISISYKELEKRFGRK